ncbi:MAG: IS200/IS605 family transposase [Melioribacteraceae bacterium]|nr:IS200/IS605 family transposase [Melioribacteraceae bacterium]MCF8420966.1 IS200/IS605 family transposase [Melioribacteraceae bacterium]
MSYIKIFIHFIWATKNREKLITKETKPKLLSHIKKNAKEKNIFIDTINCEADHIHILISLGKDQTVSKVAQMIKGESSYWWNNESGIGTNFQWQDEYMAVSVSESALERVREYIRNQEAHHRKKMFSEEYELFLRKYGFKKK